MAQATAPIIDSTNVSANGSPIRLFSNEDRTRRTEHRTPFATIFAPAENILCPCAFRLRCSRGCH
jgi:hypothetical protein